VKKLVREKSLREMLRDERGDVGLVFKVIVGVVIGVAVLGLLLMLLNVIVIPGQKEFVISDWNVTGATGHMDRKTIVLGGDSADDVTISGKVSSTQGGYVEGALVEIRGAGCNNATTTNENGEFELKCDFKLGGTPYAKATIGFQADEFLRKDITIIIKAEE